MLQAALAGGQAALSVGQMFASISQARKQAKLIKQQTENQKRLNAQLKQQSLQLSETSLLNNQGLELASRYAQNMGVGMSGSNAEVYAQGQRNARFSLANEQFQYDVKDFNINEQGRAQQGGVKAQAFESLVASTASAVGGFSNFMNARQAGGGFRRQPSSGSVAYASNMQGLVSGINDYL